MSLSTLIKPFIVYVRQEKVWQTALQINRRFNQSNQSNHTSVSGVWHPLCLDPCSVQGNTHQRNTQITWKKWKTPRGQQKRRGPSPITEVQKMLCLGNQLHIQKSKTIQIRKKNIMKIKEDVKKRFWTVTLWVKMSSLQRWEVVE